MTEYSGLMSPPESLAIQTQYLYADTSGKVIDKNGNLVAVPIEELKVVEAYTGKELTNCTMIDVVNGVAERYAHDEEGNLMLRDYDELATSRVFGHFAILDTQ